MNQQRHQVVCTPEISHEEHEVKEPVTYTKGIHQGMQQIMYRGNDLVKLTIESHLANV